MRLALGYSALIAALLILMNTYPLLMSQNLMFRSQQTALANQAVVITNALTTADQLTPAGVEQSLSQVEDLNVQRILITDGAGLVLYDSQENGVAGKYALTGEVVAALRGNDAFSSTYQDGLFSSRGAWPVMNRNRVVGAVCLYETDGDQGALLGELQRTLSGANRPVSRVFFRPLGLEPDAWESEVAELTALAAREKKTVLYVTHGVDEALLAADNVLVFGGRPAKIVQNLEITIPKADRSLTMEELSPYRAALLSALVG